MKNKNGDFRKRLIMLTPTFIMVIAGFCLAIFLSIIFNNRKLPTQTDFLARQAGKLTKAGLNHGWHVPGYRDLYDNLNGDIK